MIGTAIRNQPLGMIACAGRPRVRSSCVTAPGPGEHGLGRAVFPSFSVEARRLLTAFLVFSVLLVSAVCGPAAHQWVDRDSSAGVQLVQDVATIANIGKAPAERGAPAKGVAPALCTGHCAAHAFNLPTLFVQSVVPFVKQAVWLVLDDQWSQASRPSRLERPPRV